MEVHFLITTNLNIDFDLYLVDFGPAELEAFLSFILFAAGVFDITGIINPVT